uniref:G_PROTEIN_RECEP_F1_2 domain-containing protein n=2 Tax=Gongylonema pulchrum TaxID=637853 RepID=A0A183EID0_9BILA
LYGTVFRFYFRNIVTVFIPFFLLAYLNIRIVSTLRGQQRTASLFKFRCSEHKASKFIMSQEPRIGDLGKKRKIRSATRLTVLIVCSYLMANVLNVMITAWEYIDFESAQTEEAFWIYETCADVVSVLYVFTCATRLLVYMLCNKEIRSIIISTLRPGRRTSLAYDYHSMSSPFQYL